ncbi:hypothetical protein N8260_06090 [Amylibacter sp.]|nr:hypothetical protein [Amylibacter sp.]
MNNTDGTINRTFWLGLYSSLKLGHLDDIGQEIENFFGVGY